MGVCAITCYLHACRHQNESKSRKYLAKVLWLLTYDDDKSTLAEAVDKYCVGVPAIQWLPWYVSIMCLFTKNDMIHVELHYYNNYKVHNKVLLHVIYHLVTVTGYRSC